MNTQVMRTSASELVIERKSVVSEKPCARAYSRTVNTRRCYEMAGVGQCIIITRKSLKATDGWMENLTLTVRRMDSGSYRLEETLLQHSGIALRVEVVAKLGAGGPCQAGDFQSCGKAFKAKNADASVCTAKCSTEAHTLMVGTGYLRHMCHTKRERGLG